MLTFSYYFVLPQNRATFFNIITLLILTSSVWYLFDPALAARFSAAIIGTNLFAFLSMRQVYQLNNLLRDQATKDPLTGLLNRSTLDNTLELAISQHKRTNMPMSILFFDIDHFKNINDSLGHAVGDKVLIDLANIVSERIRETDSIFRTGGEEFLILAYNTNQQQATDIAESLRKKIELSLITDNKTITASFGVTELQQDMTVISWMKACDEKLYLAKKRGRNNVVS
jgi:diguanylate cyclase (GGDEF)-like protein